MVFSIAQIQDELQRRTILQKQLFASRRKLLKQVVDLDKKILAINPDALDSSTPFEHYGFRPVFPIVPQKAPEKATVAAPSIRDTITEILSKNRKPMLVQSILDALSAQGHPSSRSKSAYRSVLQALRYNTRAFRNTDKDDNGHWEIKKPAAKKKPKKAKTDRTKTLVTV
jgi:hypothetical protein